MTLFLFTKLIPVWFSKALFLAGLHIHAHSNFGCCIKTLNKKKTHQTTPTSSINHRNLPGLVTSFQWSFGFSSEFSYCTVFPLLEKSHFWISNVYPPVDYLISFHKINTGFLIPEIKLIYQCFLFLVINLKSTGMVPIKTLMFSAVTCYF